MKSECVSCKCLRRKHLGDRETQKPRGNACGVTKLYLLLPATSLHARHGNRIVKVVKVRFIPESSLLKSFANETGTGISESYLNAFASHIPLFLESIRHKIFILPRLISQLVPRTYINSDLFEILSFPSCMLACRIFSVQWE